MSNSVFTPGDLITGPSPQKSADEEKKEKLN